MAELLLFLLLRILVGLSRYALDSRGISPRGGVFPRESGKYPASRGNIPPRVREQRRYPDIVVSAMPTSQAPRAIEDKPQPTMELICGPCGEELKEGQPRYRKMKAHHACVLALKAIDRLGNKNPKVSGTKYKTYYIYISKALVRTRGVVALSTVR